MKKNLLIAAAFIAVSAVSLSVAAQDAAARGQKIKTKSNIKNDRMCAVNVSGTVDGCLITFNHEVTSAGDAASGRATGKRMHKPFSYRISSTDNTITEIASPRDIATGQASGRTAGGPIGGIIVKGGKNPGGGQFNKIIVEDGSFILPDGCPDGEYDMILSWSWGAGSPASSKRCQAAFILTLENGACMAINTKGTAATNK